MSLSPPPPSSRDARSIHYMLGTGSDPGGPRINETDPAPTLREATDIGQELQGEKGPSSLEQGGSRKTSRWS